MQINRFKAILFLCYGIVTIVLYWFINTTLISKINQKILQNDPQILINLTNEANEQYNELSILFDESNGHFEFERDNITESVKIPDNMNFRQFLVNFGLNDKVSNEISYALGQYFNKITPNLDVYLNYNLKKYYKKTTPSDILPQKEIIKRDYSINEISITIPKIEKIITVRRHENGLFYVTKNEIAMVKKVQKVSGTINSSLYADAINNNIPPIMIKKIIEEYSYDIDFQRDLQQGDKFEVMFEEYVDSNDKKIKDGKLLYAGLLVRKKWHRIYRHNDNFYDKNGVSVRKSLLRTPVDGARISSRFSNKRKHPVLGFTRAHKGVDFAAPIGTAVYAAGNGVVTFVGKNGGYGNLVSVKHNANYSTNYAHLSRFGTSVYVGARVKQRQVIGYIGMTGLASGPHLHFELVQNGQKINPQKHVIKSVEKINNRYIKGFKDFVNSIRFH